MAQGVTFNETDARRIAAAVRAVEQRITALATKVGGAGSARLDVVVVKVTSAASGGGKYNGRLLDFPTSDVSASGNLAAGDIGVDSGVDNCLVLNPPEIGASTHLISDGSIIHGVLRRINADGTYVVAVARASTSTSTSGLFPVNLSSDGGAAFPPTWTYTVTDPCTGDTLGTGLGPIWRPLSTQKLSTASAGVGYRDCDGNFHLYLANEAPYRATCP